MRAGALLAGAMLFLAVPASATAQGVDETCVLTMAKSNPSTANVAYPDEAAIYWTGAYQAVPGTRLRIDGDFPHARYMSFNVYDQAQRPLDAIADAEIKPEKGSANPFRKNARRNNPRRSYSVFVEFGARPENPKDRKPNTIYTGTGQGGAPSLNGALIYRVYTPDEGRDDTGGVGIPTVTLQAEDGGRAPRSACSDLRRPAASGQFNQQIAASDQNLPLPGRPTTRDVVWRKFVNLLVTAAGDNETTRTLGGSGGFFSNVHNAYMTATVSREYGNVVVTRMRAPEFPDTRGRATRMPGGQVRYFSMCENEFASQRFIACRTDDQSVIRDGFVTYVMSTPAQRPATATEECGATWLPWGPFQKGMLIYRHMLPATSFLQAIQFAEAGREAETMGDHVPVSRYYADAAAYDREVGCAA